MIVERILHPFSGCSIGIPLNIAVNVLFYYLNGNVYLTVNLFWSSGKTLYPLSYKTGYFCAVTLFVPNGKYFRD